MIPIFSMWHIPKSGIRGVRPRLVHLREELMGSQLFTLHPCIVGQYNNMDLKALVPFKSCDLFRAVILDFNTYYTQVSTCAPAMQRLVPCCTMSNCLQNHPLKLRDPSRKLKSKACHTTFVFVDCGSAVFLGVFGIAKEHAFISGSFLVFAYTAWLLIVRHYLSNKCQITTHFDVGNSLTCWLDILPHICAGGGCCI
jgi:hypothetical protein